MQQRDRTIEQYKIIVFKDDNKIFHASKHANVFDPVHETFDFNCMKKQVYENKSLAKLNYVIYRKNYHIVSAVIGGKLYDFQGFPGWADIHKYVEKIDGHTYVQVKKLLRRYRDIEREYEKKVLGKGTHER